MNKLPQWVSSRSLKISEEFYLEFEPLCIVINTLFASRVVKYTLSSQNLSWRHRCVEQSHSILANKHCAGVKMSLPKLPECRQWPGLGGGRSQQSEPVTPTASLLFTRPWRSSDSLQAHNTVTHTRFVSCRGGGWGTITAARRCCWGMQHQTFQAGACVCIRPCGVHTLLIEILLQSRERAETIWFTGTDIFCNNSP